MPGRRAFLRRRHVAAEAIGEVITGVTATQQTRLQRDAG
jgi:hypothetical protein